MFVAPLSWYQTKRLAYVCFNELLGGTTINDNLKKTEAADYREELTGFGLGKESEMLINLQSCDFDPEALGQVRLFEICYQVAEMINIDDLTTDRTVRIGMWIREFDQNRIVN